MAASLGAGHSAAVTVVLDTSNVVDIPALTGFQTTGADMDNMTVTAVFRNGTSQTLSWADTGVASGGVTGANWSLTQTGDTFTGLSWSMTNTTGAGLLSLAFDGAPGLTVFDTTFNNLVGTAGSALGKDFATNLAGDSAITATYSNAVAINGASAVGDIFHNIFVDFSQYGGAFGNFMITQDTDNDSRLNEVPVPAAAWLFGSALLGLAGIGKRKKV